MWWVDDVDRDKFKWAVWAHKDRKSEAVVGVMDTTRKLFLLKCGTPLIYGGPIHKFLVMLVNKTSAEKVLPGKYYLPLDVGEHI